MITRVVLWTLAVLVPFLAWYTIWGRTWLKTKSWMGWLYHSRFGEWTEIYLFKKSETVLWGRTLQAVGYVLTAIASLGGIDLTPIAAILPEKLQWLPPLLPLIISIAGLIQVKQRIDTTEPLAITALPNSVKQDPPVAAALEVLKEAKTEAVVVAKVVEAEKKAEGTLK